MNKANEPNGIGAIAVNVIYWSGNNQQSQVVDWTLIDSAAASIAFASQLAATTQLFQGNTAPGSAINYSVGTFNSATGSLFTSDTNVIDVSGDGQQNEGFTTATARDNALAAGIDRINGLAIGNQILVDWYNLNIKGGTAAFILQAATFGDLEKAVLDKLYYEISGTTPIPLPAPVFLLLGGLFGMGVFARRKKAA